MSQRTCRVTYRDLAGVEHTTEVAAESLYEAAVLALAAFRKNGWMETSGPATWLEVQVQEPVVKHTVSVLQIQSWLNGITRSPNEQVKKQRLKAMLG